MPRTTKISLRDIAASMGMHHMVATELLHRINSAVMDFEDGEAVVVTQSLGTFYRQTRRETRKRLGDQWYQVAERQVLQLRHPKGVGTEIDPPDDADEPTDDDPENEPLPCDDAGYLGSVFADPLSQQTFGGDFLTSVAIPASVDADSVVRVVLRSGCRAVSRAYYGGVTIDDMSQTTPEGYDRSVLREDSDLTDFQVVGQSLQITYRIGLPDVTIGGAVAFPNGVGEPATLTGLVLDLFSSQT